MFKRYFISDKYLSIEQEIPKVKMEKEADCVGLQSIAEHS